MERVAGIPSGGSERAFDLYMKCQLPRRAASGPRRGPSPPARRSATRWSRCTRSSGIPRPGRTGTKSRYRPFRRLGCHIRRGGRHHGNLARRRQTLRPRSRFAKFVNLPELVQMFRAFADVQTAEDAQPAPTRARRRQAANGRLSDVRRSERSFRPGWSSATSASAVRTGRSPRGQRSERSPPTAASSPSTAGCSSRDWISPARRSTPWSERRPDLAQTEPTRGTQMMFLRHGRAPEPVGILGLRRGRAKKLDRPRHPPPPDRGHGRCRHRREEAVLCSRRSGREPSAC